MNELFENKYLWIGAAGLLLLVFISKRNTNLSGGLLFGSEAGDTSNGDNELEKLRLQLGLEGRKADQSFNLQLASLNSQREIAALNAATNERIAEIQGTQGRLQLQQNLAELQNRLDLQRLNNDRSLSQVGLERDIASQRTRSALLGQLGQILGQIFNRQQSGNQGRTSGSSGNSGAIGSTLPQSPTLRRRTPISSVSGLESILEAIKYNSYNEPIDYSYDTIPYDIVPMDYLDYTSLPGYDYRDYLNYQDIQPIFDTNVRVVDYPDYDDVYYGFDDYVEDGIFYYYE
jgi:hypothetical protein